MSSLFDRVSLAIELDADYFPFDIGYLIGPAAFSLDYPTILRVYMHEVLHFWQTLSMGFISNLALNEWLALSEYEQTGNPSRQSDLLQAFTTRDPDLGFSASDLSEALCRFWDIHILNPEDLLKEQNQPEDHHPMIAQSLIERGKELLQQLPDNHPLRHYPSHVVARIIDGSSQPYSGRDFDRLIAELMQVKDVYAAPYSMALVRWGTNDSVILFPLVGYFALQSRAPVKVFADVISNFAQMAQLASRSRMNIHQVWADVYADVRQLCQQSCLRITGSYLTPGWDVIKRSQLADHPVYGHYMQLLEYLGQDRWYMGQRFAINPDLLFALPGDPDLRMTLATTFRPPVTLFYNGRWTRESLGQFAGFGEYIDLNDEVAKLADMADQQSQGIDLKKVLDPDLLADEAADIHRRMGEMRHAMTIARYRQR